MASFLLAKWWQRQRDSAVCGNVAGGSRDGSILFGLATGDLEVCWLIFSMYLLSVDLQSRLFFL